MSSLDAYDENDDIVTQFVEPVPEEPKWLVQVTPFDRRSMSREDLLAELREGGLIGSETLVWRRGMRNWVSVARVGEFSGSDTMALDSVPPESVPPASVPRESVPPDTIPPTRRTLRPAPAAPARLARREPRRRPSEVAVVLASSATSLLIVGVTLALLAWAGAFQAARPLSERGNPDPQLFSERGSPNPRGFSERGSPNPRGPSTSRGPLVAAPVAAPSASR